MMTGIPTVIYGFAGIFLLVPLVREGFARGFGMSILSAALLLTLLISPTMILVFLESFAAIPLTHLRALEALGATLRQKLVHVILPGARTGIITGLLLALGRALGDTMIALMVAGNATVTPESLLDSVRTQTALEDLPPALRLTAAALGAEKSATIRFVLLPQAVPGIFSGIILAIGRAAEDTAVIMLTGVVITAGIPGSLLHKYEALPFYIYYTASQFSNQQELQQGFGAALILLSLCGLLFSLSWLIRKKVTKRLLYHH